MASLFESLRYFPMARTVMGGLTASTVLTLIVLPTYYTLMDYLTVWLRRVWFGSMSPAKAGEPAALDLRTLRSEPRLPIRAANVALLRSAFAQ